MADLQKLKDEIFTRIRAIETLKEEGSSIRYAGPTLGPEEIIAAVDSIIDGQVTGWFGLGSKAASFEKELARYLGIGHCVFTNSGSSANLLAVASLSARGLIKPGDEAITPATTFPTTINPLLIYGLRPRFIDISLPSYTADIDQLQQAITKKTKLIMIPHLNGSANDMGTIMKLAKENNIHVIEDCCDAFGSKFDGKYLGTFGDLSTFSFYVAHHFTTGEGGAVASNSDDLHVTARSLRDWGRMAITDMPKTKRKLSYQKASKALPADYESRYTYVNVGYNLKPLDLQAAMGLIQLGKAAEFTRQRKQNYRYLYDALGRYSDSLMLPESLKGADNSWFVFPILVSDKARFKRRDIVKFLEKRGIETRPILAGNITKHPAYDKYNFSQTGGLPNSEKVLESGFFIGTYPGISQKERETIARAFSSFFAAV